MTRKEILQQLAAGEITREDAEKKLIELGSPVPEALSAPPVAPAKGAPTGCLIAVIIGIVLLVLLGLGITMMFFVRASPMTTHMDLNPQPSIQLHPPTIVIEESHRPARSDDAHRDSLESKDGASQPKQLKVEAEDSNQ